MRVTISPSIFLNTLWLTSLRLARCRSTATRDCPSCALLCPHRDGTMRLMTPYTWPGTPEMTSILVQTSGYYPMYVEWATITQSRGTSDLARCAISDSETPKIPPVDGECVKPRRSSWNRNLRTILRPLASYILRAWNGILQTQSIACPNEHWNQLPKFANKSGETMLVNEKVRALRLTLTKGRSSSWKTAKGRSCTTLRYRICGLQCDFPAAVYVGPSLTHHA